MWVPIDCPTLISPVTEYDQHENHGTLDLVRNSVFFFLRRKIVWPIDVPHNPRATLLLRGLLVGLGLLRNDRQ